MIDFIIVAVLVVCVVLSIAYSKRKKTGQSSCGGSCDGCSITACSKVK